MADENETGQQPERRMVREIDPRSVPKTDETFAGAEERVSAVAEQLTRAATGEFADRAAAAGGGSAAFLPNTNGERPYVQLRLEDGRTITLRQPNVAVAFILGRILGPQDSGNLLSVGYAKAMMYISEIDGQAVPRPTNMAELQNLANIVGDRNLDLVSMEFARYWPQQTELPVVKKNI